MCRNGKLFKKNFALFMDKKIVSRAFSVSLVSLALLTSGCASIISGSNQSISVKSKPEGAKVTFCNLQTGEAVSSQVTPCVVVLPRKTAYKVKIEKEDYAPLNVDIKRGMNGWCFGNAIFGLCAIIGVSVDLATGASVHLFPDDIKTELALVSSGNPSIIVEEPKVKTDPNKFGSPNSHR